MSVLFTPARWAMAAVEAAWKPRSANTASAASRSRCSVAVGAGSEVCCMQPPQERGKYDVHRQLGRAGPPAATAPSLAQPAPNLDLRGPTPLRKPRFQRLVTQSGQTGR